MPHFFLNATINIGMVWNYFTLRRPLLRATLDVEQTQARLLKKILKENEQTEFGQRHEFNGIESIKQFREKVPVQNYDQLKPYITRQETGKPALTSAPPVYYARSSGTTGRYKDIPLTKFGKNQVKEARKQLAFSLWKKTSFMHGNILGFSSPAEEGKMNNGISYGSISGSTYRSMSSIMQKKFVAPPYIFEFEDQEAKYQAYALVVLATKNLTGIAAANPSSVLKVSKIINEQADHLIEALKFGNTDKLAEETSSLLPEIRNRADKERLVSLSCKLSRTSLTPEDIWPKLNTITTWTGGSCGTAIDQLKKYIPNDVIFAEYGYAASEFIGTININIEQNKCIPLLTHNFYEFAERDNWEQGNRHFLCLHELEESKEYYVFVTNFSGLYRYDINDIIRTGQRINSCATLYFLQKGRGITNITGEKLSEYQVIAAVSNVIQDYNINMDGYMVLANEEEAKYHIYIECDNLDSLENLSAAFDSALKQQNSEYEDKRKSSRLHPPIVHQLRPNSYDIIKNLSIKSGVREAQYKPTILDYSKDWDRKLRPLTILGN